jgi:uncharacterized protein YgiM (DUF1202 family)
MIAPRKHLFLVITVLLTLSSACSSGPLAEQTVVASPNKVEVPQHSTAVAAVVKAIQANVRDKPLKSAAIVMTVKKGDLLTLNGAPANGPWYRIRDNRTRAEGWIHGSTIALLELVDTNSQPTTPTQRARTTSSAVTGRSYVNVDGVRVRSPVFSDRRPAGASARCRDGSYSFSQHRSGTCSHHGGVAEWF